MKNNAINKENEMNNRLWLEKYQNTRLKFEGVCIEIKPIKKNRYMVAFASLRANVNNVLHEIDHVNILMTQNEVEYFHLKPFNVYQFTAAIYRYRHAHSMNYQDGSMSVMVPVLTYAYSLNKLNKVVDLDTLSSTDLSLFIKNRINAFKGTFDLTDLAEQVKQKPNNGAREKFMEQLKISKEKDAVEKYIKQDMFLNKNKFQCQ